MSTSSRYLLPSGGKTQDKMQLLISAWAFLGFLVVLKADNPDWSTNILNFLSLYNARIDNWAQITREHSRKHDFIQVLNKPVDVPALRPNPVVFTEEASNGKVNILQLGVVSEGPDKVINVRLFNFTKDINHKPGQFNFDVLQNVTLEDLEGDPGCVASFVPVGERTLFANWADCRHYIHGKHPSYPLLYACDAVAASIPLDVTEKYNIVPYVYTVLERYPLVNAPEDYVSPCEKSTQSCTRSVT